MPQPEWRDPRGRMKSRRGAIHMYERSVVAAVLTNGLLDAVQPGTDAKVAAKRVVLLYQAILSELARNNLPAGDGEVRLLEAVRR